MSTTGTTSSAEDDFPAYADPIATASASDTPDGLHGTAAAERLPIRFALNRGDLCLAWRRTRLPRTGGEIALVLSNSELVLESSNSSTRAHGSIALTEPAGLPAGALVRLTVEADLFETQLCSGSPQGNSSQKVVSADRLTFESVDGLTLGPTQPAQRGYLRVQDGYRTATWPCMARGVELTPREEVPATAVRFQPRQLALAIDLGRRLMATREDVGSGLAVVNGRCQATSRHGVCFVKRDELGGLELEFAPEDLVPLCHLLDAQDVEGFSWSTGQRQVLRFGVDGCEIDRSGRALRFPDGLLDQPSHVALSISAHEFYERLPGLLKQQAEQTGDVSIMFSGGTAPALSVSVQVPGGQARLTLPAVWVDGVTELAAGKLIEGRADIAALMSLSKGGPNADRVEIHLHTRSLELREKIAGGAIRAFIVFSLQEWEPVKDPLHSL